MRPPEERELSGEERTVLRVLEDYPNLSLPDWRDLSPDPLAGMYAACTLLANHANKPNIFEPTTY